ncbi:MAG: isoprenyl transferase [Candidatus Cloacimonetes bacterium]|nr:isoprenyl transferase [Candidatus Cloacimonadota bacterium]
MVLSMHGCGEKHRKEHKEMDYRELIKELDLTKLPRHVGIIMDGNGRWAKQHHRPRLLGHRAGVKATRLAVELADEVNIQVLTMFAFSTENWSRPQSEIDGLMKLLREFMHKEVIELNRKNVHLSILGSPDKVNPKLWKEIYETAAITSRNTGLKFNIAFNYGSRQEIVEGIKALYKAASVDRSLIQNLSPEKFSDYLYTTGLPDPDLIIRTSGESRLSNFMMWQAAYAEIIISPVLWPDFSKFEFVKVLLEYQKRNRRFGGI